MAGLGRMFIFFGIFMILFGLIFIFAGKIPFIGRLPGDIEIHKKGLDVYFPLATCLIVSLLITIILNIFTRSR
jgi:hypothetical protein